MNNHVDAGPDRPCTVGSSIFVCMCARGIERDGCLHSVELFRHQSKQFVVVVAESSSSTNILHRTLPTNWTTK